MSTPDTPDVHEAPTRRLPRWAKWGAIALVGAVVLFFGAILLYAKVINDSPDELDRGDRDAALATGGDTSTDATGAGAGTGDTDSAGTATDGTAGDTAGTAGDTAGTAGDTAGTAGDVAGTAGDTAGTDGDTTGPTGGPLGPTWTVTDASELGYRVKEVLFGVDTEGVGRTNQITGALTLDGTTLTSASFEVDVASITSDESRRDAQFRDRIMSTDEFPTATFTLTEPVDLGVEATEGAAVEATITGELTLRGTTNTVTFDVDAKLENGKIGVLGAIPVTFADYGIANPSFSGITTEDSGLLEFVLIFEPA